MAGADVEDAGAKRIEGFPWLRVTRPLASFADETDSDRRFEAWLGRLGETAADARRHELANLPQARREGLTDTWAPAAAEAGLPTGLESGLAACREHLNRDTFAGEAARERLREAAVAPDEYITWQRVVGFYPIARLVARPQIVDYQAERDAVFGEPADEPVRRYAVDSEGRRDAVETARAVERDALGIPAPTRSEAARLFDAHAPVWEISTTSDSDHPGALRLTDGERPAADTNRPAEYRRLSWTRFGDEVLLQLNYMIWFPERPKEGAIDMYGGHLDGLIWRVTLGPDGEPLAYDSIHPCGCYYTLFPTDGWRVADMPGDAEPVASPVRAPDYSADERLVVRADSATHYLAGLESVERPAGDITALAPLPFGQLRSLSRPDGGNASAFAPDGLIPSSARLERFFFWPFGVPSAGAMRQWGTHAIAFVGRRHFDDPRLLERLLEPE
ncbi:hypothetical protein [Halofilum ochraceum]|uniref:hypothetical protein n=1 Tax=Halofilum ochraceum TaxID=1611323 RepID=UPI000834C60A|nr:hypothetical protein [Halofilum ochraceum]